MRTDKQLSSVNVAKTLLAKRHAFAKPSVTESRFDSKPKWKQGGRQTACSWESWICLVRIVGTPQGIETTRSFRRTSGIQRLCACLLEYRGMASPLLGGTRKRYITRALVQAHGATDGCLACQGDGQVHVPRCRKRFEDICDHDK